MEKKKEDEIGRAVKIYLEGRNLGKDFKVP